MKTSLSMFVFTAVLVASIGMTPAFGQIEAAITVTTDKTSYVEGDVILVSGTVRDKLGIPVAIQIISPNGNLAGIAQPEIDADNMFSHEFVAKGNIKKEGTHIVRVQYGDGRTAESTFEFGGAAAPPPRIDVDPKVTDTQVSFDGTDDVITYEITGGTLHSIEPDVESNSLKIAIRTTSDGVLSMTIPRTILDATMADGSDADLYVFLDSEENVFEETISENARSLVIEFPQGTEEIEIIGTYVIPEFGTIAAMILAVAIISIIAISARSRLSIVPRY